MFEDRSNIFPKKITEEMTQEVWELYPYNEDTLQGKVMGKIVEDLQDPPNICFYSRFSPYHSHSVPTVLPCDLTEKWRNKVHRPGDVIYESPMEIYMVLDLATPTKKEINWNATNEATFMSTLKDEFYYLYRIPERILSYIYQIEPGLSLRPVNNPNNLLSFARYLDSPYALGHKKLHSFRTVNQIAHKDAHYRKNLMLVTTHNNCVATYLRLKVFMDLVMTSPIKAQLLDILKMNYEGLPLAVGDQMVWVTYDLIFREVKNEKNK
jgi:hypothetical protein